MLVWNEERIDNLKRHWENGLSAIESARELEAGVAPWEVVTRNAVAGKRRRLGLRDRMRSVHPLQLRRILKARQRSFN